MSLDFHLIGLDVLYPPLDKGGAAGYLAKQQASLRCTAGA